jgi:hypothetical protein
MTISEALCEGCPPVGYCTDKTRCSPCPRRVQGRDDPLEEQVSVAAEDREAGRLAFVLAIRRIERDVLLNELTDTEERAIVDSVLEAAQGSARQATAELVAALVEAENWLRACSDWLLANDLDMTMPDGVLDTDPLDIADKLATLSRFPSPGGKEKL